MLVQCTHPSGSCTRLIKISARVHFFCHNALAKVSTKLLIYRYSLSHWIWRWNALPDYTLMSYIILDNRLRSIFVLFLFSFHSYMNSFSKLFRRLLLAFRREKILKMYWYLISDTKNRMSSLSWIIYLQMKRSILPKQMQHYINNLET